MSKYSIKYIPNSSSQQVFLKDIVENDQLNSISQILQVSLCCTQNHIKCNINNIEKIITLYGNQNCIECCWINNLLFDLGNFMFYNTPFEATFCYNNNSFNEYTTPMYIWCLVFFNDRWYILHNNKIINNIIAMNGQSYEEIFFSSWGYNKISLLPKHECHFFIKRYESIIMNDGIMHYFMSIRKVNFIIYSNTLLKIFFPISEKMLSSIRFDTNNNLLKFKVLINNELQGIIDMLSKTNDFKQTIKWAKRTNNISQFLKLFPTTSEITSTILNE